MPRFHWSRGSGFRFNTRGTGGDGRGFVWQTAALFSSVHLQIAWHCLLQSSPPGCKALQMWKCFHARCPSPAAMAHNRTLLRAELGAPSQPCTATPGHSRTSPVAENWSPHRGGGTGPPSISPTVSTGMFTPTCLKPNQRPKVGKGRAWQLCLAPRDTRWV